MHLQLWPIFLPERCDALGRVTLDQDRVAPLQRGMTPRRDVLGGVVQWLGAGLLRGVRPVRGEDVVGFPSENEVEGRAHRLAHDLSHLLVPIVHRPATVGEAAAVVLSGSARGLHDPVEGQEGAHEQLSHLSCSFLSFLSYAPTTNGPPPSRQRTRKRPVVLFTEVPRKMNSPKSIFTIVHRNPVLRRSRRPRAPYYRLTDH